MRRPNRITIFLLFVLVTTVVTSAARLFGQGSSNRNTPAQNRTTARTRDREGENFEAQFPVAEMETPEPADPDQRVKRQAKNKRYDNHDLVIRQPSEMTDESVLDNHWQEGVPGIPTTQSKVIVIGETLRAETHLSNDKKGVYTEFSVRVKEILKGDDPALVPGRVVTADRPGGFVRYPGGRKVLYRIFGMNMLRPNKQYLLFLDNPERGLNYHVLTGYEMATDGVLPLDVGLNFDSYKGMDGVSFLQVVRGAIEGN